MPQDHEFDISLPMERDNRSSKFIEVYGDLVQEVAPSSAVVTLKTNKVPRGKVYRSLTVLAMDKTSAIATSIEIGIMDGVAKKPIDVTEGSFTLGTSHTIRFPAILGPGQRIYATFTTPTAGDQLVLATHGVLVPEGCYPGEGDL